ncbi:MAG: oligosaccharide flippase family protein [Armatimonadetes bacterium]|nr:oligosaccharide flippase family protein [Armatimonadota bacterium]
MPLITGMEDSQSAVHDRSGQFFLWLRGRLAYYRQAIEDVLVSMAPQAVSLVAGVVTSVLIARGLGAEGMGQYALVLSVCGLTSQLSDLGIGRTAVRFAARAAALGDTRLQMSVLRWAFRLRMAMVLVASAAAFAVAPWIAQRFWHDPSLAPIVRLGLWIGIMSGVAGVPSVYFQSLKRFRINATVSIVQTLLTLAGIIALAWLEYWSVDAVIRVSVLTAALGAAAFIVLVPKAALFSLADLQGSAKSVLTRLWKAPDQGSAGENSLDDTGPTTFAFYMVLSSIIVAITLRADVWLMGYFLSQSEIGIYQVATRFTLPLTMLIGALNTALWPRASAVTSLPETLRLLRGTLKVSALAAVGGLLYAIFAPMATAWLFGDEYASGVFLGQLLCIRYCVALLMCPMGVVGYSFGLVRAYWGVNLVQLTVAVMLNLLLIPQFGAAGAALALIGCDASGAALVAFLAFRQLGLLPLRHRMPSKPLWRI